MKILFFPLVCLIFAQMAYATSKKGSLYDINNKGYMTEINGHNYYFGEFSTNVEKATADCLALGMKLVSFETEEEWSAIKEHLITMGIGDKMEYWTSGSNLDNGPFIWTSTNETIEYSDWAINNPQDVFKMNCIYVFPYSGWFDFWCGDIGPRYICE